MSIKSKHSFISIIVPTFNCGQKIADCLESLCAQNYRDFEVLVMDAQSSDATCQIVESFRERYPNIHLFSQRDKGIYDAMNKGIDVAGGEWLLFLGADDELHGTDVLSKISETLLQSPHDMIYGDVLLKGDTLFGKKDERYAGEFSREKIVKQNICHQSIFYSRRVFEILGKYRLDYPVNADWDINQQCLARLETRYVPQIIARFSPGGQSSQLVDRFYEKDRVLNSARYFKIGYLDKTFRGQGKAFYRISADHLLQRKYTKAAFFAFAAFYQSPAEVTRYVLSSISRIKKK